MNPVYYNDEEYQEIINYFNQLTQEAETLPYPQAKELTTAILQYFDLVHREGLARIIQLVEQQNPALLEELKTDFATNTLLRLYELIKEQKPKGQVGFIPVEQVKILSPQMETVWIESGNIAELKNRHLYPKELADENVLLCKVDQKIFAVRNACVDSVLPMQLGKVEGYELVCPWHGCRYDLQTGASLDKPGEKLVTYRIAVGRQGDFKVGILKEKSV